MYCPLLNFSLTSFSILFLLIGILIVNHLNHCQQPLGKGIFLHCQVDSTHQCSIPLPSLPHLDCNESCVANLKLLKIATERQVIRLCQKTETQRKSAITRRYSLFLQTCAIQPRNGYFSGRSGLFIQHLLSADHQQT